MTTAPKQVLPKHVLLVGLGNPGPAYAGNRHNVGFMWADAWREAHSFGAWSAKFQSALCSGEVGGVKVVLLKPQTFMNLSGQAVRAAADFYKIAPQHILVAHDELDLPPMDVRHKFDGGHAGHNGLKSLIAHLGTPAFHRLRIGIGHPGQRELVSPYVLSDFSKAEAPDVATLCQRLATEKTGLSQILGAPVGPRPNHHTNT